MIPEKMRSTIKDSEFQPELEELIFLTGKLKAYSRYLFLTMVLSICSLSAYAYYHNIYKNYERKFGESDFYFDGKIEFFIWIVTLVFLVLSIGNLYQFSSAKKKGNVIYDELTEELDWGYKRKEYIKRPPIETRIVIKDFIQNTDLPFTNNQNGQAFYFTFIFIEAIAIILVKSL